MPTDFQDCPCSGKNISHYTAPWILLALYHHPGTHGYEIKKIVNNYLEDLGLSVNITGLYRHLKNLEQRGVISPQWDIQDTGPAKRRYYLTDEGQQCFRNWMQTLFIQFEVIARFFDEAKKIFPSAGFPRIEV